MFAPTLTFVPCFSDTEIGDAYVNGQFVKPVINPNDARQTVRVTAFQAHAAIARSGLYEQVETLMTADDTPLEVKLAWNKAQEFRRLSPVVLAMAAKLGLTDKQLDDLFALAETIEA
jgi:hypothetical protein